MMKCPDGSGQLNWSEVESTIQALASSSLTFIEPKHLPRLAGNEFDAKAAISKLEDAIKKPRNISKKHVEYR